MLLYVHICMYICVYICIDAIYASAHTKEEPSKRTRTSGRSRPSRNRLTPTTATKCNTLAE